MTPDVDGVNLLDDTLLSNRSNETTISVTSSTTTKVILKPSVVETVDLKQTLVAKPVAEGDKDVPKGPCVKSFCCYDRNATSQNETIPNVSFDCQEQTANQSSICKSVLVACQPLLGQVCQVNSTSLWCRIDQVCGTNKKPDCTIASIDAAIEASKTTTTTTVLTSTTNTTIALTAGTTTLPSTTPVATTTTTTTTTTSKLFSSTEWRSNRFRLSLSSVNYNNHRNNNYGDDDTAFDYASEQTIDGRIGYRWTLRESIAQEDRCLLSFRQFGSHDLHLSGIGLFPLGYFLLDLSHARRRFSIVDEAREYQSIDIALRSIASTDAEWQCSTVVVLRSCLVEIRFHSDSFLFSLGRYWKLLHILNLSLRHGVEVFRTAKFNLAVSVLSRSTGGPTARYLRRIRLLLIQYSNHQPNEKAVGQVPFSLD